MFSGSPSTRSARTAMFAVLGAVILFLGAMGARRAYTDYLPCIRMNDEKNNCDQFTPSYVDQSTKVGMIVMLGIISCCLACCRSALCPWIEDWEEAGERHADNANILFAPPPVQIAMQPVNHAAARPSPNNVPD